MHFIKKYNQEIVLGLFCVGMFFYALGLSGFGKSFKLQTFFHIGGLLFIIFNYRLFSKDTLKCLFIPIISFIVVFVLGLLTLFDDVWERSVPVVLKAVNQHIVGYFILFTIMFLFGLYARMRNIILFLVFFTILCILEVCSTIYLGATNGRFSVPFFFKAVYTYNIWLIAPAAIALAGIFVFKKRSHKILSGIFLVLTFCAILVNGERSFLVAFIVMIFVPFFVWHYKHRLKLVFLIICVGIVFLLGFYHLSKSFSPRYNFAHMVDNFEIVWNTKPIEMGQYDPYCFDDSASLQCASESLILGQSNVTWEHSSLARINMTKSTFLAFLDSPLRPHIVGVFQIGEYLWYYYNIKNHQNRSYLKFQHELNGYNHSHNFVISLLFSYGLIGFICIVVFQCFLLCSGYKALKKDVFISFWGLSLIIFVCGIAVQSLFDALYGNILECIFIFCAVISALGWRNENLTNNQ